MEPEVILVDENDKQIGIDKKTHAHEGEGHLHRAFSIFVFNSKGETMLQQRAHTKYHAGDKWTNTVCSHPAPGESILEAAHRRLKEEMGFDCELREVFSFTYKANMGNGLTEHEFDHVVFGNYDKDPKLNPEEAESWKWVNLDDLNEDMEKNPDNYSPWAKLIIKRVISERSQMKA